MTRYMRRIMTRQMQRTDTKTSWIRVSALPSLYIYIYIQLYMRQRAGIYFGYSAASAAIGIYTTHARVFEARDTSDKGEGRGTNIHLNIASAGRRSHPQNAL